MPYNTSLPGSLCCLNTTFFWGWTSPLKFYVRGTVEELYYGLCPCRSIGWNWSCQICIRHHFWCWDLQGYVWTIYRVAQVDWQLFVCAVICIHVCVACCREFCRMWRLTERCWVTGKCTHLISLTSLNTLMIPCLSNTGMYTHQLLAVIIV